MLSFKPTFSLSSFIFIRRLFSSSLLSAIRVMSSAYLWLLIFLPAILIPASVSSSLAFHMMYSAWQPTPVSLPGKSHGPWSLVGYHPWGRKESDMTEQLHFHFVSKLMSLFFNMLSRLVITFLSRSKHLLISWLQSPSAMILEPRKIKSATVSPSICNEVMGPDAMILVF